MKKAWVLILLSVLVFACATKKEAQDNTAAEGLQGNWELTLFTPGDKEFAELFGQRRPALEFNTAEKTVTGTTGCNRLSGNYAIKGNSFQFGSNMVLTKMACPSYDENKFLNAMSTVNHFKIKSDQLHLLQDTTLVMVFTKKK